MTVAFWMKTMLQIFESANECLKTVGCNLSNTKQLKVVLVLLFALRGNMKVCSRV